MGDSQWKEISLGDQCFGFPPEGSSGSPGGRSGRARGRFGRGRKHRIEPAWRSPPSVVQTRWGSHTPARDDGVSSCTISLRNAHGTGIPDDRHVYYAWHLCRVANPPRCKGTLPARRRGSASPADRAARSVRLRHPSGPAIWPRTRASPMAMSGSRPPPSARVCLCSHRSSPPRPTLIPEAAGVSVALAERDEASVP